MSAPDHELVGLIAARLRITPSVTALVGNRTLYKADENTIVPYITMGDATVRRDDATCIRSSEVDITIHVWTGGGNPLQDARAVAYAVSEALHDAPIALTNHRLVNLRHTATRAFYDVDDVTGHSVIEFTASTEAL
jgi:hypothetical protein